MRKNLVTLNKELVNQLKAYDEDLVKVAETKSQDAKIKLTEVEKELTG